MPLNFTRPDLLPADPNQRAIPEVKDESLFTNIGIGIDLGWDNTTQGFVGSVAAEADAKRRYETFGESEVPQAVYNDPTQGVGIPGVEWEPHMTYELLDEIRSSKKVMQDFMENDSYSKYFGAFIGAAIDPVNLIPIPFAKGGGIIKTAGKIAAFNMATEATLTPLITSAYETRKEPLEIDDIMLNIGMAGALGGLIGGGGAVLGRGATKVNDLLDASFGSGLPTPALRKLDPTDPKFRAVADKISTLLQQAKATIAPLTNPNSKLENIDFSPNSNQFIDITGRVTSEQPSSDAFVKITTSKDGSINISGNTEMIAKFRNQLSAILPEAKISVTLNNNTKTFDTAADMVEDINLRLTNKEITISGNQDGFDDIFEVNLNEEITVQIRNGEYVFFKSTKNKDGSVTTSRIPDDELDNIEKKILEILPQDEDVSVALREKRQLADETTNTSYEKIQKDKQTVMEQQTRDMTDADAYITLNSLQKIKESIEKGIPYKRATDQTLRRQAEKNAGELALTTYTREQIEGVGFTIRPDNSLSTGNTPANLTADQINIRNQIENNIKAFEGNNQLSKAFNDAWQCMKGK